MKQRNIKFEYRPNSIQMSKTGKSYCCLQVTESTEYNPGEFYNKKTVEDLIANRNWKVTIVAE